MGVLFQPPGCWLRCCPWPPGGSGCPALGLGPGAAGWPGGGGPGLAGGPGSGGRAGTAPLLLSPHFCAPGRTGQSPAALTSWPCPGELLLTSRLAGGRMDAGRRRGEGSPTPDPDRGRGRGPEPALPREAVPGRAGGGCSPRAHRGLSRGSGALGSRTRGVGGEWGVCLLSLCDHRAGSLLCGRDGVLTGTLTWHFWLL